MLTLEINGKFITWPEEFAILMIGHYKNNGIPFTVHRNCVHAGWSTSAANAVLAGLADKSNDRALPCDHE
ncbi:MAG TPA: hypothetical protein VF799_03995 [Geobacteraceae bacterium]